MFDHVQASTQQQRGTPIRESHIRFYLEHNFTIQQIANMFGCSRRTVERRMGEYGNSSRDRYSQIGDNDLVTLVSSFVSQNPNLGQRSIDGLLRTQSVVIKRQHLRETMWAVDPEGVQVCLRCSLHWREYHVEGPNALYHVDGYHKLVRWKMVIHGDSFS